MKQRFAFSTRVLYPLYYCPSILTRCNSFIHARSRPIITRARQIPFIRKRVKFEKRSQVYHKPTSRNDIQNCSAPLSRTKHSLLSAVSKYALIWRLKKKFFLRKRREGCSFERAERRDLPLYPEIQKVEDVLCHVDPEGRKAAERER